MQMKPFVYFMLRSAALDPWFRRSFIEPFMGCFVLRRSALAVFRKRALFETNLPDE